MGDEFNYRAELFLISLHDHLMRGISLGINNDGVELATCVVAVFVLHNTFLDEDFVIYEGKARIYVMPIDFILGYWLIKG